MRTSGFERHPFLFSVDTDASAGLQHVPRWERDLAGASTSHVEQLRWPRVLFGPRGFQPHGSHPVAAACPAPESEHPLTWRKEGQRPPKRFCCKRQEKEKAAVLSYLPRCQLLVLLPRYATSFLTFSITRALFSRLPSLPLPLPISPGKNLDPPRQGKRETHLSVRMEGVGLGFSASVGLQ